MMSIESAIADLRRDVGSLRADFKQTLGALVPKIDSMIAQFPHLATKSDVADKPSKQHMYTFVAVCFAIAFAALAVGWNMRGVENAKNAVDRPTPIPQTQSR